MPMFTTPRSVAKRQKNRVYFDYLQNGKSKTIAAPYVLRAYGGAPSTAVTGALQYAQTNGRGGRGCPTACRTTAAGCVPMTCG